MSNLFRCLLLVATGTVLGAGAVAAKAERHDDWGARDEATCSRGQLAPGTYERLVVRGTCTVKGAVTVNGNVRVARGADLDAAYLATRFTVNGNISVGTGARLELGCAASYHDCDQGAPADWAGKVIVNGNIVANRALTIYLDSTTVHGNVVVNAGGDLSMVDPNGLVLPIKDNEVDGNIVVQGWQGAWFGIIRNTVGGNVIAADTRGTRLGDGGTPDSTEIATNLIGGNLSCLHNTPAAQIGDSHGTLNTVGGNRTGECTGL